MLLFLHKICVQGESTDNFSYLANDFPNNQEHIQSPPLSPAQSNTLESPVSIDESAVDSGSVKLYYDDTLQRYIMIPLDTSTNEISTVTQRDPSTSSGSSQGMISPQLPASFSSPSSSSCSSRSETPLAEPSSAPPKRPHEKEKILFSIRGTKDPEDPRKSSYLIQEAVDTVKDLPKQDIVPPTLDRFKLLGSYIASKLRSVSPEDAQYYKGRLLETLIKPRGRWRLLPFKSKF